MKKTNNKEKEHFYEKWVDEFSYSIIDIVILASATMTISYWLVLFARAPAWSWYPISSIFILFAIGWYLKSKEVFRLLRPDATGWVLIILCLLCALISVFTHKPDMDDVSFFHRALYTIHHLSEAFPLHHTAYDPPDLPPISAPHVFTSFETCMALLAKALHLPPLSFLHQGISGIALFLLPVFYFCLFRTLGLTCGQAIVATSGVIIFLVASGDRHQDWGNFTILRAWQGKCIYILLILPLLWTFGLRYLIEGRFSDILRLHAITLIGIGLTSTGFFLAPYVVGTLCLSGLVIDGFCKVTFLRLLKAASLLLVIGILALILTSSFFPSMTDYSVWEQGEETPLSLANIVIPNKATALLYASFFLLVFFWKGQGENKERKWRIFLAYAFAVSAMPFIPGISDTLMKITKTGAYWRLFYAIPAPALFGSVLGIAIASLNRRLLVWRLVSAGVVFTLFLSFKQYAINPEIISIPPQMIKLPQEALRISNVFSDKIGQQSVIMVPEELAWVIALDRPDLRFLSVRYLEVLHAFSNYPDTKEGQIRLPLSLFLSNTSTWEKEINSIKPYIERTDALIFPSLLQQKVEEMLDEHWERMEYEGWMLWLHRKSSVS